MTPARPDPPHPGKQPPDRRPDPTNDPAGPEPPEGLDLPAGYPIAGYRTGAFLGAGAWGSVHAAEGPDGTPAAVKILGAARFSPGQRRTVVRMARSEQRFSRLADHPHLIRTLAVVTVEDPDHPDLDGAVALVMERAARSLQDVLAEARPGTAVPGAERILAEVCAGLTHMHRAGWVHGDLKPANILLMPDGTAKIADFGLTAELEGTHAYAPPLGSPDHVPPEWWSQRTGARGIAVRPSADIWAFGVIAHQLLTGGLHPFLGATARARSLAAQAYARGAAPLRTDEALPPRWRAVVATCLAPGREERARTDLAALVARATARPARSRRTVVRAGAGLLAAALAVLALAGAPEPAGPPRHRAPPPLTGAIPAGSDVPPAYRGMIEVAARRCPEPEVTPALLAAMLKAESGFDPNAARPETGEYGIAMWTPAVFEAWAKAATHAGPKSYLDPGDAIAAMGNYVCWLDQQLKHDGFTRDLPALVTAAYRTSDKTVTAAGGVPERVRPHVERVLRYLADYGG
ncbi:transglycosylase-like protein with SLT domain [Streptomyces sp. 1114.5]|uniref:serine/threonine-protein kinase n=1 Tax=Streptomyces sp. 1114.5 TaxID=1938830 RepID=UPI000EAF3FD0|nr:serine/threonine-protein kinase [Streptomyces sp. 1114.5]RKT08890.1 transglycosylase-like protein with SLT domain [Streptomyces sp. 1114.5]